MRKHPLPSLKALCKVSRRSYEICSSLVFQHVVIDVTAVDSERCAFLTRATRILDPMFGA